MKTSTYVQNPPYFEGMTKQSPTRPSATSQGRARSWALFADSITTDHISPAGDIKARSSPAGEYPDRAAASIRRTSTSTARGAAITTIMMRGTFANIRIKNEMVGAGRGRRDDALPAVGRADDDL